MASVPGDQNETHSTPEVVEEDSPRIKELLKTLRSAEGSRLMLRFKQGDAVNDWLALAYIETDGLERSYSLDDISRISGFKKSYLSKMASVAATFGAGLRPKLRKRLVTFTDLYYAYQFMDKMPEPVQPLDGVEAILEAKQRDPKNPVEQALIAAGVEAPRTRTAWSPPDDIESIDDPFPYLTRPPARDKGARPDRKVLKQFEAAKERVRRSLAKISGDVLMDQPNLALTVVMDDWDVPHLTGWHASADDKVKQRLLATIIEFARHQMSAEDFKSAVEEIFDEIDETIGQWDVFFEEHDPEAAKRAQLRKLDKDIAKLQARHDRLKDGLVGTAIEWPDLSNVLVEKAARAPASAR